MASLSIVVVVITTCAEATHRVTALTRDNVVGSAITICAPLTVALGAWTRAGLLIIDADAVAAALRLDAGLIADPGFRALYWDLITRPQAGADPCRTALTPTWAPAGRGTTAQRATRDTA